MVGGCVVAVAVAFVISFFLLLLFSLPGFFCSTLLMAEIYLLRFVRID